MTGSSAAFRGLLLPTAVFDPPLLLTVRPAATCLGFGLLTARPAAGPAAIINSGHLGATHGLPSSAAAVADLLAKRVSDETVAIWVWSGARARLGAGGLLENCRARARAGETACWRMSPQ